MPSLDAYPALSSHWLIACRSSELQRKPLKRTILDTHLALFRVADGQAAALLDRCPHRNAPLSRGWIAGNHVVCPYHGWQFDAKGVCQAVPGLCGVPQHRTRNVQSYPVIEQDGFVWVSVQADAPPTAAPYRFPLLHSAGYTSFIDEFQLDAALPDALENFLDGTHTHFVHSGLIRTEGQRKQTIAIIRRAPEYVEAEYRDEGQQSGLISRLFGAGVDVAFGRFVLPSIAQLEYRAGATTRLLVNLFFTPQTPDSLRVFVIVTGQAPGALCWLAPLVGRLLLTQVVRQDRAILTLQAANLRRFGGPRYTSTELDVLGPHILRMLTNTQPRTAPADVIEKRVAMLM
jgi:phenylpropionate dioxygenase-like ring-hydroxylating dioxygenase large terminal subunit